MADSEKANEIEITEAMIEAGEDAYWENDIDEIGSPRFISIIIRAVLAAHQSS